MEIESMKAFCWERFQQDDNSEVKRNYGVGIYSVDEDGNPDTCIVQVEMDKNEMIELANDLLETASRNRKFYEIDIDEDL